MLSNCKIRSLRTLFTWTTHITAGLTSSDDKISFFRFTPTCVYGHGIILTLIAQLQSYCLTSVDFKKPVRQQEGKTSAIFA